MKKKEKLKISVGSNSLTKANFRKPINLSNLGGNNTFLLDAIDGTLGHQSGGNGGPSARLYCNDTICCDARWDFDILTGKQILIITCWRRGHLPEWTIVEYL
jgi:hypothetical protein